ncbi:MAG: hypothetical protein Ta2G_05220 [Termitinemataceae bacterium]|nr:MAG: hypothetical protein Ta2G_05220 [Termitinemataceae bacterium]
MSRLKLNITVFVSLIIVSGVFFTIAVRGVNAAVNDADIRESSEHHATEGDVRPLTAKASTASVPRAQQVMQALNKAYPTLVGLPVKKGGDWAALVRGKWFYYEQGRLLRQDMLEAADNYMPQPFYNYVRGAPQWKKPSAEEAARLSNAASRRRTVGPSRSPAFYDDLWNIHNKNEAIANQKTCRIFGRDVQVHKFIADKLLAVEKKINLLAQTEGSVQEWKNSLDSITGFNWRNIADLGSRSNHSYGIAIDFQARNPKKLETYWLWTAQKKMDWWNVPDTERLIPPTPVIKAFEENGFIWGGKWVFYDTMHFEYRPEILLLNEA